MDTHILDSPDEILELIVFYVISDPWKNDVQDYVSLTSTCRRFYRFSKNEKFWKKLASRRDPTNEKPQEFLTWSDYCKKIYLMRTIPSDDLIDKISRFNENYFCTVEKVILWPNRIRIYIDERGDYSLGGIQHPRHSTLSLVGSQDSDDYITSDKKKHVCDLKFSIQDPTSQYLGYIDFPIDFSNAPIGNIVLFQYGFSGYSVIKLFEIEQKLIDKFNLLPLLRRR